MYNEFIIWDIKHGVFKWHSQTSRARRWFWYTPKISPSCLGHFITRHRPMIILSRRSNISLHTAKGWGTKAPHTALMKPPMKFLSTGVVYWVRSPNIFWMPQMQLMMTHDLPNGSMKYTHGMYSILFTGCACQQPYSWPHPQTTEWRESSFIHNYNCWHATYQPLLAAGLRMLWCRSHQLGNCDTTTKAACHFHLLHHIQGTYPSFCVTHMQLLIWWSLTVMQTNM